MMLGVRCLSDSDRAHDRILPKVLRKQFEGENEQARGEAAPCLVPRKMEKGLEFNPFVLTIAEGFAYRICTS